MGDNTDSDSATGDDVAVDAATAAIPNDIAEIPIADELVAADGAAGRGLHQLDAHVIAGQLVVPDQRARPG